MMERDKINFKRVARQGAYEIASASLKRLCVNATPLSNTNLCLFIEFANDDAMFWATMAQVMQDVSSTTVVTREQKIGWELSKLML